MGERNSSLAGTVLTSRGTDLENLEDRDRRESSDDLTDVIQPNRPRRWSDPKSLAFTAFACLGILALSRAWLQPGQDDFQSANQTAGQSEARLKPQTNIAENSGLSRPFLTLAEKTKAKAEVSLQRIFDSLDVSNLDCVDDLGYEEQLSSLITACDSVLFGPRFRSGTSVRSVGVDVPAMMLRDSAEVINKHYGTRQADATWRTKDTNELGDRFLKDSSDQVYPGEREALSSSRWRPKALNSEDEEQAVNMMNSKRISVKRLVRMHSNEIKDVNEAGAGDIVALAGVDCESGVTFTDGKAKVTCSSMFVPDPAACLHGAPFWRCVQVM
eukprot:Skav230165  [mRNA]  locus=scaffold996:145698:161002:- [translate_table: standard]